MYPPAPVVHSEWVCALDSAFAHHLLFLVVILFTYQLIYIVMLDKRISCRQVSKAVVTLISLRRISQHLSSVDFNAQKACTQFSLYQVSKKINNTASLCKNIKQSSVLTQMHDKYNITSISVNNAHAIHRLVLFFTNDFTKNICLEKLTITIKPFKMRNVVARRPNMSENRPQSKP